MYREKERRDGKLRIGFRYLVNVPSVEARSFEDQLTYRLNGEGSRKWSAASAMKHEDVETVIAVSQDGPVYIYTPSPDNKKIQVAQFNPD